MRFCFLLGLALCLFASHSAAKPIWEIAVTWTCKSESHFKIHLEGRNLQVNTERNTMRFDFDRSMVTSAFGNQAGEVIARKYYASQIGNSNYIVIQWKFGIYNSTIFEKNGEYWLSSASGHADSDRMLWISNYRCRPES
jgi:hypothetical protein